LQAEKKNAIMNWNWPSRQGNNVLTDTATNAETRIRAIKRVRAFRGIKKLENLCKNFNFKRVFSSKIKEKLS
jgi:hypothetical protein